MVSRRCSLTVAIFLILSFSQSGFCQRNGRTRPVAHAEANSGPVTLTPAIVEAGSPELIRVEAPAATSVEGEWFGHKLQFFRAHDRRGWYALAGVDVEAAAVPVTLRITAHLKASPTIDRMRDLSTNVAIHPAHYRTGSLTVQPKFVEPGPEAVAEACREIVELRLAVEFASRDARQERRAEPGPTRLLCGRPALLKPFEVQKRSFRRLDNVPHDAQMALRRG